MFWAPSLMPSYHIYKQNATDIMTDTIVVTAVMSKIMGSRARPCEGVKELMGR